MKLRKKRDPNLQLIDKYEFSKLFETKKMGTGENFTANSPTIIPALKVKNTMDSAVAEQIKREQEWLKEV